MPKLLKLFASSSEYSAVGLPGDDGHKKTFISMEYPGFAGGMLTGLSAPFVQSIFRYTLVCSTYGRINVHADGPYVSVPFGAREIGHSQRLIGLRETPLARTGS